MYSNRSSLQSMPAFYSQNSSSSALQSSYVNPTIYPVSSSSDDRIFAGGFLGPFILGGITGGLLAPSFGRPGYGYGYGRPIYNNNYYYQNPPYYYGPYYR